MVRYTTLTMGGRKYSVTRSGGASKWSIRVEVRPGAYATIGKHEFWDEAWMLASKHARKYPV